ncbi:MAG: sigma-70 family RNA polymerase sigma factor [Croceitalea sp.]|nr:sigma-70 family RNA polymerase sigma factor [Croceitalea sp.]NNC33616.1 sigma-70 family RNA polymerase sigma factor [Croceitalea sp.]NNM18078.1 sigma-70 family RNA polymerase sigma factor [Croceitalea sp.]
MKHHLKDKEFIQRLTNDDQRALYQLYDKYSGALFGVILRMCRNQELAEDLLQETFIKIWQKIDAYDDTKGSFYTWAYRIAKNITLNSLRKPDLLIQTDDLSVYKDKEETSVEVDFSELNGAVRKLEPHHQEAIALVYFRGLTHREAYEEMGVPLGTFKSYIRQALLLLRESYGQELTIIVLLIEIFG